jgi:hypothetical protein
LPNPLAAVEELERGCLSAEEGAKAGFQDTGFNDTAAGAESPLPRGVARWAFVRYLPQAPAIDFACP